MTNQQQGLFRPQAVANQSAKLDGNVIIAQPLASKVLLTALLAVVVITLIFLINASFHRKETVMGYLQPSAGLAKIMVQRSGIVNTLFVDNGDTVNAGDPLALIHIPEFLSDGQNVSALLANTLNQQLNFVDIRTSELTSQFNQQKLALTQRIIMGKQSLKETQAQLKLLNERLVIQIKRYSNIRHLVGTGAIAKNDASQQQDIMLSLKQQVSELHTSYQTQTSQVDQLNAQLIQLPSEHTQQLAMLNAEKTRINQQLAEASARGQVLLTAPIAGKVTNLVAETGTAIRGQLPLATIVPNNDVLKAILLVPTRAFGFVESGQQTRIRFDAFPYQRFGLFEGKVTHAANSILLPGEVEMPINIQEPVYRVEVALGKQEIRAYGNSVPLQPGMTLSADVVLEQRSLLSWLLEPILSLKGQV
ncbi:HlyD family secretion protein [Glaciecola sp. 2405UD65-10]|uniref:HlyD family secretion protein n=1 Tax=Glaciecola sp. 2405UD65-10 TaxID=3397244 RepID=UPI003B5A831D